MLGPIKVGQKYKSRDGRTAIVVIVNPKLQYGDATYAVSIEFSGGERTLVWGNGHAAGRSSMSHESPEDLVELIQSIPEPEQLDLFGEFQC